ncbi:glycosyltransferase family 4 protein [Mesorhizobium sp. M0923]|uniref:glycosyltransferase family 4 protein n=1 Tax=Mesorhizobium sp. M0923 TaxID=2957028 RepID=UPI00333554C5
MMKPVVLLFVRHYLPGFKSGGPIRTIQNLVDHLSSEIDFRIVTSDRDATDTEPYRNIVSNTWLERGGARVFYCSPEAKKFSKVRELIAGTPHDIMYLNSYFDPVFTVKPLVARRFFNGEFRPCIIAPRGEFAGSALALKSLRKSAFINCAHAVGLYSGVTWQASSEAEAQDIARILPNAENSVVICNNLPPLKNGKIVRNPRRDTAIPLQVCFLSRITPMKNLDFALQVLMRVKHPVHFSIYGPIRDEQYWGQCQTLIRSLPESVTVDFAGPVAHNDVAEKLSCHDLFFLPTRGENYGHVILEALSAGLPILIADTTPWSHVVENGAGWALPLNNIDAFVQRINEIAVLDADNHELMRRQAKALALRHLHDEGAVPSTLKLFTNSLGG